MVPTPSELSFGVAVNSSPCWNVPVTDAVPSSSTWVTVIVNTSLTEPVLESVAVTVTFDEPFWSDT